MKSLLQGAAAGAVFAACLCLVLAGRGGRVEESHALEAFENWYNQRALPFEQIPQGAFTRAAEYVRRSMRKERAPEGLTAGSEAWSSIGPDNIGGRVLALAVNPVNPSILWAGSAGGGLWVSSSGGSGANAWTRVETGFPSLAVSSIAIDPSDPDVMYIGTGEVGSVYKRAQVGTPGARSTYGMGVLKTPDGGATWSQTGLVFTFPEITAVQKVIVNPKNGATLFAATTEGTYRSQDAGATWTRVHSVLMAMDIAMNPVDTTVLYEACGQRNSTPNPGIYKSTDGGSSWALQGGGLPLSNIGRTSLAIAQSNPQIVYAGIASAGSSALLGLYRTLDGGTTWSAASGAPNYVGGQGWYDNVVVIHPTSPGTVFAAGLDIYRTTNVGFSWSQRSHWYAGYGGVVPAGGPEGPSDYSHADHHALVFDPTNPAIMYIGNDGGVFATTDGGATFEGRNGGFTTTQFYNGFAPAEDDSSIAIGGLQDNGTVKFLGANSWSKVYGGDGGWCAIDPTNHDVLYEEYVYLTLSKSVDGGESWSSINSGLPPNNSTYSNFIAPFVIAPSNPSVLYAGATIVYKTTNGGESWDPTNSNTELNGVPMACIGVSFAGSETLLAGTGSGSVGATPLFEIYSSMNGGATWANVTGSLPSRYPTDITYDPNAALTATCTYSGYGTPHVFRTTNNGGSWTDISSNLPDIPAQTVAVDPEVPGHLYVGTDLGAFRTTDGGASWEAFSAGMGETMVTDLTISRPKRTIRASTFGNGVYERTLPPFVTLSSPNGGEQVAAGSVQPITWREKFVSAVRIELSTDGGAGWSGIAADVDASAGSYEWHVPAAPAAYALVRITGMSDSSVRDQSNAPFSIEAASQTISVAPGWNLLSLPADTFALRSVLFPRSISSIFVFSGGYMERDTIRPGEGFWLKFGKGDTADLSGRPLLTLTMPLVTGWNLIGAISQSVDIAAAQVSPPGNLASSYFGYEGRYLEAASLEPTRGYWIKAHGPGSIVLTAPLPVARRK